MMRSSLSLLNVGIVAKWIDTKGFGFIKDSNTQKEYFVHFRSLNMGDKGHRGLNVGQEVQFDPDDSDTRSQAVNVTSVGGGPLPPFDAEAAHNFSGGGGGGGGGRGGYGRGRGGDNFNRGDNYNNNNNNRGDNYNNNNNNGGGNFRGVAAGRGSGGNFRGAAAAIRGRDDNFRGAAAAIRGRDDNFRGGGAAIRGRGNYGNNNTNDGGFRGNAMQGGGDF